MITAGAYSPTEGSPVPFLKSIMRRFRCSSKMHSEFRWRNLGIVMGKVWIQILLVSFVLRGTFDLLLSFSEADIARLRSF